MKNILILEDEAASNRLLTDIISECREEVAVYSAYDEKEAAQIIVDCRIDLFVIDISLHEECSNDVTGVTFAKKLREMDLYQVTPIIFITSIANLELHTYREVSCFNYILKPIDPEKQKQIVQEVEKLLKNTGSSSNDQYYYFKIESVLYPTKVSEIISIRCKHRRLHIHTVNDEFVVSNLSLKQFMRDLNKIGYNPFIECIRGVMINMDYIENIDSINRYVKIRYEEEPIDYGASRWLTKLTRSNLE